jgi:hypothetical protein
VRRCTAQRRQIRQERPRRGQHPGTDLRLIRHDTSTGGLAEGLCGLAVIRAPIDLEPWAHVQIGQEARCAALASDDPWARRRAIRLAEIPGRPLAIDSRTGITALNLWPEEDQPFPATERE